MSPKVDFLIKSELIREAQIRGLDVQSDIRVIDLKHKLRCLIKLGVQPNPSHVAKKIVGNEEFEIVKASLDKLEEKIQEIAASVSLTDVIRVEAKLAHYGMRVEYMGVLFEQSEGIKGRIQGLRTKLGSLNEAITNLHVDISAKERVEHEMTRNWEMDDELDESVRENAERSRSHNDSHEHDREEVQTKQDTSCLSYHKLPNPLERYLNKFKVTDGLNAHYLIQFIKNMLALKRETKLKDKEIFDIILTYCNGPLYSKILKCKEDSLTINETHVTLLKQFIPIGLRENMKKEFVHRPQRNGEPLEVYIQDVKTYSGVLNTGYDEQEVTEFIKLGIHPDTRAKLVFMGNPVTFNDLENICVQVQNISYSDAQRKDTKLHSHEKMFKPHSSFDKIRTDKYKPISNVNTSDTRTRTCFICNKEGHIAKECWHRPPEHKYGPQERGGEKWRQHPSTRGEWERNQVRHPTTRPRMDGGGEKRYGGRGEGERGPYPPVPAARHPQRHPQGTMTTSRPGNPGTSRGPSQQPEN